MSRNYEFGQYARSASRLNPPISEREFVGGLTATGHGNVVTDNVLLIHPSPDALQDVVEEVCMSENKKSDLVDYRVIYVLIAAAAVYMLVYR